MRFGAARRERESALIDLTAMLDVVFNLLLFFVVTTSFAEDRPAAEGTPGIQVNLPQSGAQAIISDDRDINVWMTVDGAVFVDDKPVDLDALQQVFRERAAATAETLVVIKADEGVSHGRVVRVMDLAKMHGLSRLAIATDAEKDETEEAP